MQVVTDQDFQNIGTICEAVINDPHNQIDNLELLQKSLDVSNWKYRSVLLISLTKVYLNIIPLYKIKVLKEKIKFNSEEELISIFDNKLLKTYKQFINKLIEFDNELTYECAINLLKSVKHFNFSDLLANKILKETISKKIDFSDILSSSFNSENKEFLEKVLNKMIDLTFHPNLMDCLINLDLQEMNDKNISNNLFRIYFSVLKNEKKEFFIPTFKGLIHFKDFIPIKYLEGLNILLNSCLKFNDCISKLECIICIYTVFNESYDFSNSINALYQVIEPLKYSKIDENKLILIFNTFFILKRQPLQRTKIFLHRLMQYSLLKYSRKIKDLILQLKMIYQIDFQEKCLIGNVKYKYDEEVVDCVGDKLFTEFELFSRLYNLNS